ncbi:hypothetical protein, partial [Streptomyces calidiresistens]
MTDPQIILTYSRGRGIVAIPHGTRYKAAHQLLTSCGFREDESGVHHLPDGEPDLARDRVASLVRLSKFYRAEVTTGSRQFIGDTAGDIAALLPGEWKARVEIYSNPHWQEDLVPWLWDSGELARVVRHERVPCAAALTDTASETTLLLIERPDREAGYLVGALSPEFFEEGHGDRHAPPGIAVLGSAASAARAITDHYLPAYRRAVHDRRLACVAEALDRIRTEHDDQSTGTAPEHDDIGAPVPEERTARLPGRVWEEFRSVLRHAPPLLDRCRSSAPEGSPEDRVLARLVDALVDVESLDGGTSSKPPVPDAPLRSAVDTWLTHGETFLRRARAAAPPT